MGKAAAAPLLATGASTAAASGAVTTSLFAGAGGSLLAPAVATAAAPAATAAAAGGFSALTGLSLAGQLLSTAGQFSAQSGQMSSIQQQIDFQNRQTELQIERERTDAALKAAQRERRLRRALASQRAAFGGIVETGSGTPFRLQEELISSANRAQEVEDLNTRQNILNLNVEREQNTIGAKAEISSIKTRRLSTLGNSLITTAEVFS